MYCIVVDIVLRITLRIAPPVFSKISTRASPFSNRARFTIEASEVREDQWPDAAKCVGGHSAAAATCFQTVTPGPPPRPLAASPRFYSAVDARRPRLCPLTAARQLEDDDRSAEISDTRRLGCRCAARGVGARSRPRRTKSQRPCPRWTRSWSRPRPRRTRPCLGPRPQ